MEDFLGLFFLRSLIRNIGKYSRYYFFLLTGKKKPIKSFSNSSKDEYKDWEKNLTQDFTNSLVGFIIILAISVAGVVIFFT